MSQQTSSQAAPTTTAPQTTAPTSAATTRPPPPPTTTTITAPQPTTTPSSSSIPPSTTPPTTSAATTATSSSTPSSSSLNLTSISSSTSLRLTTGDQGGPITITSIVAVTPTRSVAPTRSDAAGTKTGFLQNKGAVAGVFSVIGLVVLAILVALLTNTVRRRRAKKFDREIAEAAREAAAAQPPAFLDDDNDRPYEAGKYSGGVYSDVSSHGTFGQPARSLGHGQESYGMRELGGGASMDDPFGAAGGAAGIGIARARSMRDGGGYAAALAEGQSPYPAFAAPGSVQHHGMYDVGVPPQRGPGSPEHDLLEAAGMGGGGVAAAAAAGMNRGPPFDYRPAHAEPMDLSRNKSLGTRSHGDPITASTGEYPYTSPGSESYASHYQPGFRADTGAGAYQGQELEVPNGGQGDMYGGYGEAASLGSPGTLPNPFSPSASAATHDTVQGQRSGGSQGEEVGAAFMESDGEDEEDQGGRRVLKVANE